MNYEQSDAKLASRAVKWAAAGILFLLLWLGSCGIVNYGERRVLPRFGAVTGNVKEASAIANKPLVLQLRALEKWNGILPQYVGSGSIPFVQIN